MLPLHLKHETLQCFILHHYIPPLLFANFKSKVVN